MAELREGRQRDEQSHHASRDMTESRFHRLRLLTGALMYTEWKWVARSSYDARP
jgi:hypothetical protein